jgi:DNA-directed RNA polymerase subunit RPC12/RpoP
MSLFSITCTTCKSRLAVRDSGAIGQILACPKCGGMVMVKPPAGWQGEPEGGSPATAVPAGIVAPQAAAQSASAHVPSPAPPAAARPAGQHRPPTADQTATDILPSGRRAGRDTEATLSDSHFDAVDDLLSDAPPRAMPTVLPASSAPTGSTPSVQSADAANLTRGRFAGGSLPAPTKAANPDSAPPVAANIAGAEEPVDFEEAIAASRARPRSFWPLYFGAFAAGTALAVAVVVAASNYFTDRTPSGPIAKAGGGQSVSPANDPATSSPDNPAANPTDTGKPAPTPANPASPTDKPAEIDPSPALDPSAGPIDPAPMDMPPADPATETPAASDPPADPAGAPPAPRPISPFDRLLENDPDPLARPTDPPTSPAPGSETVPEPTEAARPSLPRPPERTVDVAARLADPLPLIEAADTPLVDFLGVLSDLSTIPITLDPDGLPLVQARATSPITFKLQSTTVGQALRTGIAPYKLAMVEEGNQLLVTLAEPPTMRKLNYPLAGLAESETEAEYVADLVRSLVAPESWQPLAAGTEAATASETEGAADEASESSDPAGRGTIAVSADQLAIQQTMAVHARVFFLLERLRTARGQRHLPYTAKFDPVWLSLATRHEQAAPKLAAPVTANFSYGAQLGTILKHLESVAGVRILVDWRALAAAGWNPDGEVPFTAEAEPLSAVLTRLAQSMDLDWRAIDADTLELTSTDALAAKPDIEFYEVKDLAADEAAGQSLIAQLQSDLGSTLFAAAGGPYSLRYDAKGRCLLATLPQAKQRELAEKLATLRGK